MAVRRPDEDEVVHERERVGRVTTATVERPERPRARRKKSWGWAWVIGGLALLALAAVVLIPLLDGPDEVAGPVDRPATEPLGGISAGPAEGITVSQIVEEPATFYGREVTVSGEVEETLGLRAFAMEDADLVADEQLLVVGATQPLDEVGQPLEVNRLGDQNVRVLGTVRPFRLAEVEQEIGFDLEDNAFREWENKPAVIARRIELNPVR